MIDYKNLKLETGNTVYVKMYDVLQQKYSFSEMVVIKTPSDPKWLFLMFGDYIVYLRDQYGYTRSISITNLVSKEEYEEQTKEATVKFKKGQTIKVFDAESLAFSGVHRINDEELTVICDEVLNDGGQEVIICQRGDRIVKVSVKMIPTGRVKDLMEKKQNIESKINALEDQIALIDAEIATLLETK